MKANNDLRMAAKGSGIPLWAIAERQNISEQTLFRRLRKEFTADEKKRFRLTIEELKGELCNV